ncbi:MAG: mechanosensitive ion channel family protein [Myxococcota bacterium]
MDDLFDVAQWRQLVMDSAGELGTTVAGFLPNLVATLLILGVGWLVSKAVEVVASRALHRVGLDEAVRRLGLDRPLQRAGVASTPSRLTGRLLFWVLMLTFVLSAVETLGLTAVTTTIDRLIAYLPNVLAAGLIVVVGLLLGAFSRSAIGSAAAAAQVQQAERLGAATQSLVVAAVVVLALEQLGVNTELLIAVISVVLGALSLAGGLAFALGARPVVAHILAGHFLRQSLQQGESVEIAGRRGTLERVGPVDTLLSDGAQRWSIPNARVLEQEVGR